MGDIDGDHDRDGQGLNSTFVILLSPGENNSLHFSLLGCRSEQL